MNDGFSTFLEYISPEFNLHRQECSSNPHVEEFTEETELPVNYYLSLSAELSQSQEREQNGAVFE